MILGAAQIAKRLAGEKGDPDDPLVISPAPNLAQLRASGAASVDLRVGTWFVVSRARKVTHVDVMATDDVAIPEQRLTKTVYVPFHDHFVLHPGAFVLAATLEWIRIPRDLTGYVTGKSSWGRRGLIIETAMGVHPSFSGCLTLELANVGDVPIRIHPGMLLCQLFLHRTDGDDTHADKSVYVGYGRPVLGSPRVDEFARKLQAEESL